MNMVLPTVRADKTTRNADDLRVMMAGTMFLIFLILMQPLAMKFYDEFIAERPFVSATVQVLAVENSPVPVILYDADATQPVTGQWVASIHSYRNGVAERITSRRGNGTYHDREDSPRVWSWAAFFDNEQDSSTPEVPTEPFKVCVSYSVNTRDSGIGDETPEFCSVVFDPTDPTHRFYDFAIDGEIQ